MAFLFCLLVNTGGMVQFLKPAYVMQKDYARKTQPVLALLLMSGSRLL